MNPDNWAAIQNRKAKIDLPASFTDSITAHSVRARALSLSHTHTRTHTLLYGLSFRWTGFENLRSPLCGAGMAKLRCIILLKSVGPYFRSKSFLVRQLQCLEAKWREAEAPSGRSCSQHSRRFRLNPVPSIHVISVNDLDDILAPGFH